MTQFLVAYVGAGVGKTHIPAGDGQRTQCGARVSRTVLSHLSADCPECLKTSGQQPTSRQAS